MIFVFSLARAQRVSNVSVNQEGPKIRIQYELSSPSPVEVRLYISSDDGATWNRITKCLTGDIGSKVSGGFNEIFWDVLQERESLIGDDIRFKIKIINEIKSVKIGNQIWMAENLSVDQYRNGDTIPTGFSNAQWEWTTQGAYAIYKEDPANEELYGKLYNWYAVNDARGLCPLGWHVPSDDEWVILAAQLGGSEIAGGKLKSMTLWKFPNTGAMNSLDFSALPGGMRNTDGSYSALEICNYLWCKTMLDSELAWHRMLNFNYGNLYRMNTKKSCGMSVRCIKD